MRHVSFLFFPLLLSAIVDGQTTLVKGNFNLNGKVIGKDTGYVHLFYLNNGREFHDSCILSNGTFQFNGTIKEPSMASLYGNTRFNGFNDTNMIYFFLEPATLNGVFELNKFNQGKIVGSTSNEDYLKFKNEADKAVAKWKLVLDRLDNANKAKDIKIVDSIWAYQMPLYKAAIQAMRIKFINDNPNSYVSAYALTLLRLNTDSLKMLIESLSPAIRRSDLVRKMNEKIINIEKEAVAVGREAPDFTVIDINGDTVSLQDFRGKYVLLDFWASWCKPCRESNPTLVKMFNSYKNRGFTIIGFSLDDYNSKDAWKAAIRKDGLKYPQVSDLKGRESVVAKLYNIQEIPFNLLLDKNGKIISLNVYGEDLEKKLEQLLN